MKAPIFDLTLQNKVSLSCQRLKVMIIESDYRIFSSVSILRQDSFVLKSTCTSQQGQME
jgi:hypothetical protein